MIIACATDESYAEMAGVLLRSIRLKGDVPDAEIVVVGDRLSEATVDALRVCGEGLKFRHLDLGEARGVIAGLPVSAYRTAIHIRLLLPDLIEGDDRLLYLDADTLVNGSLRPLFELDLGSNLLAAVEDCGKEQVRLVANPRIGSPPDAPYYNSGVLLFELGEWRRLGIGRQCMRCAAERDDFWPDQDAINIVLRGRIQTLEPSWNFFSRERLPRRAFEEARILHFITAKPLSADCGHPLFDEYLAIRRTTPWGDKPLTGSARERQIDRLKQVAMMRLRRARASEAPSAS